MVVPLPCPTLRSLVRGCIGAAAVLVCVAGCTRPDPEPPPAVLPSVESVAERTVDPAESDPPSVEVEQWPDDPEVRAAVEAYVAFEEALLEQTRSGAAAPSRRAAHAVTKPSSQARLFADDVAIQDAAAGPTRLSGVLRSAVLEAEVKDDTALIHACWDTTALESELDFTNTLKASVQATRHEDSWRLTDYSPEMGESCS